METAAAPSMSMQISFPTEVGPLALNQIRDNYGARKKKRRLGRGIGSGRGRKCGRGSKGKYSRAGNHGYLRGRGDAQLWKTVPKRGFRRTYRQGQRNFCWLNLSDLQRALRSGRLTLPADKPLTVKELYDARLVTLRHKHQGIKLLGRGEADFALPIRIEVQDATRRAIEAVERCGGQIETVYYSQLTLRALLKPEKFGADAKRPRLPPRPALPKPRLWKHYAAEEKRGYLRHLKPGDVVRPHEQPGHVQLEPPEGGRWPAPRQIGYQSFSYKQPEEADEESGGSGDGGDAAERS
jgi:large subunit ribosomal protein L15